MKPSILLRGVAVPVALLVAAPALAQASGSSSSPIADVRFRTSGDRAELRYRGANDAADTRITVVGVDEVLALLADTDMTPIWPAIEAWAGPDLTLLRDRRIAATLEDMTLGRSRGTPQTTAEAVVRAPTRAVIRHVSALAEAGRLEEARRLLTQRLATTPVSGLLNQQEHAVLAASLAYVLEEMDQVPSALAMLEGTSARLADADARLNLDITRAHLLNLAGRYADALALIDTTQAAFLASNARHRIAGASLQFDAVRACALHGIGRTDEAAALADGIRAADDPVDRNTLPVANRDLLERIYLCTGDAAALAALWARDLESRTLTRGAMLATQPVGGLGRGRARATFERARKLFHPSEPARVLPDRYAGALTNWRAP